MGEKIYTQEELDLYIRFPDRLTGEQKSAIEIYLRKNMLAAEYVALQRKMYAELDKDIQQPPTKSDFERADTLLRKRQFLLPSLGLTRPGKKDFLTSPFEIIAERRAPLPVRFIRYAGIHPVKTGSFAVAAMVAIVLAFNMFSPRLDSNPMYAKVINNVLMVYNKEGAKLWTKPAVGTPDYGMNDDFASGHMRPFLIADVDGDGINEVLTNLYNEKYLGQATTNTLTCYSNAGTERWHFALAADLSGIEKGRMHAEQTEIYDFAVVPGYGLKKPMIFVAFGYPNAYPSCIAEIDPVQKKEVQLYWHVGEIQKLFASDVDGDRKKELLFTGINNFENAVFVAALDPYSISGPTSVSFTGFMDGRRAQELFYCLFPPTSLCLDLRAVKYNGIGDMEPLEGEDFVKIATTEDDGWSAMNGIFYTLNKRLEVVSVVPGSGFQKKYSEALQSGKYNLEPLTAEYYNKLKHNVRWWDGEKFVNYPTFNKKSSKHLVLP